MFYFIKATEPPRPPPPAIVGPAFPDFDLRLVVLGLALFGLEVGAGLVALCLGAVTFARAERLNRDGTATRGALAIGLALFGWGGLVWMMLSK